MGIAINQPELFGGDQHASPASEVIPAGRTQTEPSPREVVRCQQCSLVQFRTLSDLCRRCTKPLPSWIQFSAAADAEQNRTSTLELDSDIVDSEMPADRAGRNRQVSIGGRMQELREERLLTQIEMASLLGIPRSYLSRIENSRLLPGPMMVAKFASALKLDISELLPLERRKDGGRLFPSDPAMAALYTQIAKLPVPELEKVLEIVRRMVPGSVNPQREADGPAELPQRPAALSALTQPELKRPPASVRQGTNPLATVAGQVSLARR